VKKIFLIFVALSLGIVLLGLPAPSSADAPKKPIYEFWSKYCPHCKDENAFLEKLAKERQDFELKSYEVTSDQSGADLFKRFAEACGNKNYSVPALYIGDKTIIGFQDEGTTGQEIRAALDSYTADNYPDPLKKVEAKESLSGAAQCEKPAASEKVKLPLLGEVDLKKASLPLLTVVLGTVDGFNPCAMWALVALLTLLLAMGSRRRVLLVGGVFLIASWTIYYLFMAAWLNVFSFLKFDLPIRIIIAAVALYTGWQLIKSFRKETEECEVKPGKGRVHRQIEALSGTGSLVALIIGAIALAFSVNLIEFMCSVNLPVIYTKVLSMADLSSIQYYLYLAAYNTLYMLDDIVVFLIALFSLKAFQGFARRYSRWTKLIGAIVIIIIGVLLLVRPQWLTG